MTTLSATTTAPAAVERRQGIPTSRLVRVELRKLVDTRAGWWLTASIGVIAVIVAAAMLIAKRNDPASLNFGQFFSVMNIPTTIILPVLAIMLVTSEWSQRTALGTFTMEPRRERIVAAKLMTALIAAVAAVVVALALAAISTLIAGIAFSDPAGEWNLSAAALVNSLVLQVFGLLLGFGFAAVTLSTPGAIVAYFALPTAFAIVTQLIPWFADHLGRWVDPSSTNEPLHETVWPSAAQWSHLIVSALLWIAIPVTLGVWRILRSEVK